jgi:poly(A) polymerase/tRNA nucleotidyltransferase (CCA-adding enzyme)
MARTKKATTVRFPGKLPVGVKWTINTLHKAGFEGYGVGGGVRDTLLGREPKDWDVATNATPVQIQKVFPKSVYTNRFGTVGVKRGPQVYDVTTYRVESAYADARHPDQVEFVKNLDEDLARRDFTINAIATDGTVLIDPYNGLGDLKKKLIKAVGNPNERFSEDALRMMRAVRLSVELGFKLDPKTEEAVGRNAERLKLVSPERIRDEFMRILASDRPEQGVRLLIRTRLVDVFLPELLEGDHFAQAKHHTDPVLEHNLLTLKHVPSTDPLVRLAALLHDIGKPRSARGKGARRTFHGHEVIGARMTKEIMRRLHFSAADIERVTNLVRHHMFMFQFESTDKAVRRIIRRVGNENIDDLVDLRVGDRLGSGCRVGYNKKLKLFKDRVIDVQKDPIDTRMLKIDGNDLMKEFDKPPGPWLGEVMDALLEDVLDDPKRNTKKYLMGRAKELVSQPVAAKS